MELPYVGQQRQPTAYPKDVVSGRGETTRGLLKTSAARPAGPHFVGGSFDPPVHARTFYKLVYIDGKDSTPTSIVDNKTKYGVGNTFCQTGLKEEEGAMYVLSNSRDAVLKEGCWRRGAGKQHMHVAIARVLAWNSGLLDEPKIIGAKKVFSFIRVLDLEQVPQAFHVELGIDAPAATPAGPSRQSQGPAPVPWDQATEPPAARGGSLTVSGGLGGGAAAPDAQRTSLPAAAMYDDPGPGCIVKQRRPAAVSSWLSQGTVGDMPTPVLETRPLGGPEAGGGLGAGMVRSSSLSRSVTTSGSRLQSAGTGTMGGSRPVSRGSGSRGPGLDGSWGLGFMGPGLEEEATCSQASLSSSRQATERLMKDIEQMEQQLKQMRGI